jgi:hypothetical protein
MNTSLAYKSCFIHIESFQLTHSSGWIPRFKLTRQDVQNEWDNTPSYRDRLDKVFLSKDEADEFALEDAMQWIDQNGRSSS